ncbi:hypothetical protein C8R44DRAFT_852256 [Mycena epipterygia]|nr:hypothetical protein C8R44DRAFT_852256 [Mycena epipterygia]
MDSGAEFNFESSTNDPGSVPYTGAFFPASQNFTVAGGVFESRVTNHIHQAAPSLPSDFRRIPLGDIDLQREIRMDTCGVVRRAHEPGSVRRMYSAKIAGRKSNMTVSMYQGDTAEEEWLEAISKYSWLR